jgi:hypothetical protein
MAKNTEIVINLRSAPSNPVEYRYFSIGLGLRCMPTRISSTSYRYRYRRVPLVPVWYSYTGNERECEITNDVYSYSISNTGTCTFGYS